MHDSHVRTIEDRQRLLTRLLAAEGHPARSRCIPRRPDVAAAPVSAAQQRIWFLEQLQPGTPFYTIGAAFRLGGPLDEAALAHGLSVVLARHEVLRGRFQMIDGALVQRIAPAEDVAIETVDLQCLPSAARETEARRLAGAHIQQPFDLVNGSLFRTALYRLGLDDRLFVVAVHHIAFDAGSVSVLLHELGELYDAVRAHRPPVLPDLPIQYADYAAWQAAHREHDPCEADLAYWRAQLAGAPAILELPTDFIRREVQRFRGARLSRVIEPDTDARVKVFSRQQAVSPFVTLLAAFVVLLHRYTGQSDILVGCPVANRNSSETERLIGLFVNLLVVRTDVADNPTFRTLVSRLRRTIAAGHAHDSVPFDRLVEELRPDRRLSHTPLVQVMFTLQTVETRLRLRDIKVAPVAVETGTAKFDLTLNIVDCGEERSAHFEYDADLFAADRIGRMLGHFRTILLEAMANPDRRIRWLPMLAPEESQQILETWNPHGLHEREDDPVQMLVADRARSAPDALAVVDGTIRLTYGELDRRARALATRLRGDGVGPEDVVAIWMHRSADLVVSVLAVLYAGAGYLPIDPDTPEERVAYMLDDALVRVVLTQRTLFARQFEDRIIRVVDAAAPEQDAPPNEAPDPCVEPANVAYFIYTSGSTGAPKAVAVPHSALSNLVAWHRRAYSVTADDRTTLIASPAFDAAVWELWPYLAAGASVYVVPNEVIEHPVSLCRWLAAERITMTFLPTPLAEAVLQESGIRALPLRVLLTGGDRLREAPTNPLPFALVNHYGPTENGVVSTCVIVNGRPDEMPPIGRPIDRTEAYVLDAAWQPVPVGIVGELFVGGANLARGYHGRPDLTAERFLPHPFGRRPGERLYATGDLVRLRPDGTLDFVGRRDGQVKVRGFRIELGEIEGALMQHPSVRACAAAAWPNIVGDTRLIAYIVQRDGAAEESGDYRTHLAARLPEYMIPAAFVPVDTLPLTANGKIDRARLPAPTTEVTQTRRGTRPPRTEIERAVARVWSQVLGVPLPDLGDHFFEAGGHSVMAMRLLSRIHTVLGVELPVRELFRQPTLGALAAAVEAAMPSVGDPLDPPLQPLPRGDLAREEVSARLSALLPLVQ